MGTEPFLVPFKSFHVEYMELREYDKIVFFSLPNNYRELLAYERSGYSWTGVVDGQIIGSGGVCKLWEGTACCWLITTPLVEQYKKFLHRTVINVLRNAIKTLDLHRIETTILTGHIVSQRWARRLGFEEEGLMRKLDSKKNDYFRYAWVKEDEKP